MPDPRYPIGHFEWKGSITAEERERLIDIIADTPAQLRAAVKGLSDQQLDTPYREGGWTVRQVVHHLPDSHLNAYTRMKLTLTEDNPTIKPYLEAKWAELMDSRMPIETSFCLLECLHKRWVALLCSLKPEDFARTFRHPEHEGALSLDWLVALYAWHGPHHLAHVMVVNERVG
jgi:hypothetical protein